MRRLDHRQGVRARAVPALTGSAGREGDHHSSTARVGGEELEGLRTAAWNGSGTAVSIDHKRRMQRRPPASGPPDAGPTSKGPSRRGTRRWMRETE